MSLFSSDFEGIKLENVETTLDKNIQSFVHKWEKCFSGFHSDLPQLYNWATEIRHKEKLLVCKNIQTITKTLKDKVDLFRSKKMAEITDFDAFKIEMINIQDSILNFKKVSKSELLKLTPLEGELNDELELYYNGKTPEWGTSSNIAAFDFIPPKIKTKPLAGESKEVRQFFDFVHESGGHENGWRQEDHLLFLKMRKKCKNDNDLAKELHEILPDIGIEEIKEHDEWYKQYLKLQHKKKQAIQQWKQSKSRVLSSNSDKTAVLKASCAAKSMNMDLKEKLIHWKVEKEEKLLIEQEIEKQRTQEKIERERIKRRRQNELKKLVNEWRETKKLFEQCQRQQERINEELEKKRRAANANRMIKQFRSLDEIHISKMRQTRRKFDDEPVKRAQSGPPVARDPKRLMKPTVQWTQRVRALREPLSGQWPVITMPKLGVPDWRKSVS